MKNIMQTKKSFLQPKGFQDIRTTTSTHLRSTPRREGSNYLEVYLLDKEKERLEREVTVMAKRQRRIYGRLREIQETMGLLVEKAGARGATKAGPDATPAPQAPSPPAASADAETWTKLTIEY